MEDLRTERGGKLPRRVELLTKHEGFPDDTSESLGWPVALGRDHFSERTAGTPGGV